MYWLAIKNISASVSPSLLAHDFTSGAITLPFTQLAGTAVRAGHYQTTETGSTLSSNIATYYTNSNWNAAAPRFPLFGIK